MQGDELYPVFLKLSGRRVLVVGDRNATRAKVQSLVRAGALVRRIDPARFRAGDVSRAWLVVAAGAPDVNRRVARAAEARRVFVNAVDDPPNASAYLSGVVRRARVTVAVSTAGRAPALAGLLREGLDALLPVDLDRWAAAAGRRRRRWRNAGTPVPARRPDLLNALNRLYGRRAR